MIYLYPALPQKSSPSSVISVVGNWTKHAEGEANCTASQSRPQEQRAAVYDAAFMLNSRLPRSRARYVQIGINIPNCIPVHRNKHSGFPHLQSLGPDKLAGVSCREPGGRHSAPIRRVWNFWLKLREIGVESTMTTGGDVFAPEELITRVYRRQRGSAMRTTIASGLFCVAAVVLGVTRADAFIVDVDCVPWPGGGEICKISACDITIDIVPIPSVNQDILIAENFTLPLPNPFRGHRVALLYTGRGVDPGSSGNGQIKVIYDRGDSDTLNGTGSTPTGKVVIWPCPWKPTALLYDQSQSSWLPEHGRGPAERALLHAGV